MESWPSEKKILNMSTIREYIIGPFELWVWNVVVETIKSEIYGLNLGEIGEGLIFMG